ncbi:MAG: DEAD/DEAH box helicase family protein [Deltaproteobacteria bacterium]|nr:DEAD/DEAH box helicase family protein [Deltaproteobacteria bacterium]
MPLLTDHTWPAMFKKSDGNLASRFFVPALACAKRYDRTTGYFKATALTLAARGVEGLVRLGGHMRLLVGMTLDPPEIAAIAAGLSEREAIARKMAADPWPTQGEDADADAALELLAWMVAHHHLEVKVAVPKAANAGHAIFHVKSGIFEDKVGNRLAFNGSVNETAAGWANNWESFHVFRDWAGADGKEHVNAEDESFQRLWADQDPAASVYTVPAAIAEKLLAYVPPSGQMPIRLTDLPLPAVTPKPVAPAPVLVDLRAKAWRRLLDAAKAGPGSDRVAEATCAVDLWPHQLRAFRRVYDQWPCRVLIADEVGLGKTVQAGLVLRQAWLAGRAKRVLIMAPKAVVGQWQAELRDKFALDWPIYDGQQLLWRDTFANKAAGRTGKPVARAAWHKEPFVIVSSHLLRMADRQPEVLDQAEPWDIVVLDEAHHARRKGAGSTRDEGPNQMLRLMRALAPKTPSLLLLTATPMQVHPVEIFDLLALLKMPATWNGDEFVRYFEKLALPNPTDADLHWFSGLFRASEAAYGPLPQAAVLRVAVGLTTGRLAPVEKVLRALRDAKSGIPRANLTAPERAIACQLLKIGSPVARLVSRHTRELLRAYFNAGKISTPMASRHVEDIEVEMTAAERSVYDDVQTYIEAAWEAADPNKRNAVGFVLTVYCRRVASSFAALRRTLEGRVAKVATGNADEDTADVAETGDAGEEASAAKALAEAATQAEADALAALLAKLQPLPPDTKAEHCVRVLRLLAADGCQQCLVFTQYTDTLDFLRDHLVQAGFGVLCFSGRGGEARGTDGRWQIIGRENAKRRFKAGGPAAQILLCTDAAAEGLNFQFCGALINYDLPWNPMRVEQRIGRIDRLGQTSAKLRIVNLHYKDTVEHDVYLALRQRIDLFQGVVGKLQPILAKLPATLAEFTLKAKKGAAAGRQALVEELGSQITAAAKGGFDIDAVTDADLELAPRPKSPIALADFATVLDDPKLIPNGYAAASLHDGDWSLTVPGSLDTVRVTVDAKRYAEHPDNLELWVLGNPICVPPASAATAE